MPAVQLGALLAVALAASAQQQVATAGRPPASAMAGAIPPSSSMVMGALPTPPGKVVLETKTYGTVTVDHAAHLARRTACRSCHGDGPVSKIGFTPRQAHETCRGCHADMKRGPVDCRGCHVLPPKPVEVSAAEPPPAAPAAPPSALPSHATGSGPPPPRGPGVAAQPSPAGAPLVAQVPAGPGLAAPASSPSPSLPAPPPPPTYEEDLDDEPDGELVPFRQTVEVGMIALGGPDQSLGFGPSFRLVSRHGRAVMMHSIDSSGGFRTGRTMLLVGGGAVLPVRPRLGLMVIGMGGMDAAGTDVWLLPAAGVRVGLQWIRPVPYLDTLSASFATVSDLVRRRNAFGEREGDVTFSFAVSAGYALGSAAR